MSGFDILIKNGIVVDGAGAKPYRADVAIQAGRISKIGDLADATAKRVLDAEGRFVAPGFIDPHTHFDAQIFYDPTCSDALQNGVTTVLMSNCGIGLAPCHPDDRERYMLMLEAVEQIPHAVQKAILPWSWESLPEFIDALKHQKKALNMMVYAPLAPIQMFVMGIPESKSRRPTDAEIDDMKALISEAMDAGAVGLWIFYQGENSGHVDSDGTALPNDLLSFDDVSRIAKVLTERDDGLIQLVAGRAGIDPTAALSEKLTSLGRPVLHSFLSQAGDDPPYVAQAVDDPDFKVNKKLMFEGMVIAGQYCITCHGNDLIAAGKAPDLRTSPAVMDEGTFLGIVRDRMLSVQGMPKHKDLTNAQLKAVRQYIRVRAADLRWDRN